MATQSIDLKVQTGSAQADTDSVADALDGLGEAASGAEKELADLAKTLNSFLSARGQAVGKTPRLLNLDEDKKALEELKRQFQEVINANPTLRGPIGLANGVNRPSVPSQVNLPGVSSSQAGQAQFMEKMLTRLLSHHLSNSQNPIRTGLTAEDLTGRPARGPLPGHQPGDPSDPRHPRQPDTPMARGAKVLGYAAQQLSPLGGGAGVALGNAASMGAEGMAGRGIGGAIGGVGMGGMAAGGLAALLGYGVFKGASAINDGIDENKVEATDIDKFRRSLGGTSDSFNDLRDASRRIGDAFNLTYIESRKLSTQFTNIAKSNIGAVDQAGEGVGLAQAVGLDESQGSGFMANLRHDGSIGEKKSDARMMGMQFAEALKRTGSTLNAGEMMTALQGFSSSTAQRGLSAPNMEGFAGMLSAMVGSKTPGLDVGNSARILGQADASFQAGGGMGEASNTLQYMAMGGDKLGVLGVKARQAAGMFASDDSTFGDEAGAINKYMRGQGADDYRGHTSKESGLKQVMRQFDESGASADTKLLGVANHFKLNPQQAATLYNLRDEDKLDGMGKMSEKYKGVMDLEKMSSAGYMAAADIGHANGDMGELEKIKTGFGVREKLTDDQRTQLKGMNGIKDPEKLEAALVKFAGTLERERTQGEEIAKNAADTAKAANRMADGLLQPTIDSRNFLAALVVAMAPKSETAKKIMEEERAAGLKKASENVANGTATDPEKRNLRGDILQRMQKAPAGAERMEIAKEDYRTFGKSTLKTPFMDSWFQPGELDAMRKSVDAEKANLRPAMPGGDPREIGKQAGNAGRGTQGVPAPSPDAETAIRGAAERSGFNPDHLLGLAKLETQMGKKSIKGDGRDSNNLFNVKGETGGGIRAFDKAEGSSDAYRAYGSYDESANDVVSLLARKYPGAKDAKSPAEFAKALKSGGYATDPNYEAKLTGAIGKPGSKGGVGFDPGKYFDDMTDAEKQKIPKEKRPGYRGDPLQLPDGNPQAKAEAKAEAQKVSMQISPMNWSANINLMHEYGGREQTQMASASGVTKPRATGVLA